MMNYQPFFFCGDEMEELFEELSKFARKNRKALKPAEQWLNEFDGNIDDAWNVARNSTHIDWRKIVLVVKWTLDEGVEYLLNTILSGSYTTREHPNRYLIRNALEEGRKAVADEKTAKQKNLIPAGQNGGNPSVVNNVNNITISDSQIGSVQAGVNNRSVSNAERHKNTEKKKSVFLEIIVKVVIGIVVAGLLFIAKILYNLLTK